MDGLLIDSERMIMQACMIAAKEIGITYTQSDYLEIVGLAWPEYSSLLAKQLGGERNFQHVMQRINARLNNGNSSYPLKTGTLALLQHYKANNIICGVASSSPISHIQECLSAAGIIDYFSAITSGHEVKNGKPNPDIYLLAMQRLKAIVDFDIKESIAFEDSNPGARAAIAAGLNVVVVPDLKQPNAFVKENSFKIIGSLDQFLLTL